MLVEGKNNHFIHDRDTFIVRLKHFQGTNPLYPNSAISVLYLCLACASSVLDLYSLQKWALFKP